MFRSVIILSYWECVDALVACTDNYIALCSFFILQCDLFIQEGARLGRTPAEVVSMCDITFSCVSDPKAARDVG